MRGIRFPSKGANGGQDSGGTLRSIWLAPGCTGDPAQYLLHGFDDRIILLGRGEITDVGPGARCDAAVRLEFLLSIRFWFPFGDSPHVVLLPDTLSRRQDGGPAVTARTRAVGPDGFTLVLLPRPGSPRCTLRFHWVAIGPSGPPSSVSPEREALSHPWHGSRGGEAAGPPDPGPDPGSSVPSLRGLRAGARRRLAPAGSAGVPR